MLSQAKPLAQAENPRHLSRPEQGMRPAFKSTAHLTAFLALVLLCLSLPVLLNKSGRLTPRDSYEIMPENHGPYTFVESEIFDTKGDIDILFLGNSLIWAGIDTPLVEQELAKKLNRKVRVVSFGSSWAGLDIPYTQLRDLLERKKVGLVILSIPRINFEDGPPPPAFRFLRNDAYPDITSELGLKYRISTYAGNVLRSPHDLLTLVRRNRSQPSDYTKSFGALMSEQGWIPTGDQFTVFVPDSPVIPSTELVYSSDTRDNFQFTGVNLPPYHQFYLIKIVELLKRYRSPLAMINIPQYSEHSSQKVLEENFWPAILGCDVPLIGVPPAALYGGLNEDQIRKLHYNEHMNKNGSEFFTRTVMPAILETYVKYAQDN
jgi:hypothetical protein